MGTINYRTSNYITLGYDLSYDFEEDFETYEEAQEYKQLDIEDMWENIDFLLKDYDFWYYHISILPGYYEGFSIDIECNYGIAWDDCYQKKAAQKEITQLKKFLLDCIGYGACVVRPGWCTTYLDRTDSIKEIKEAIKEIRTEAKNTPTWAQYERGTK